MLAENLSGKAMVREWQSKKINGMEMKKVARTGIQHPNGLLLA